MAFATMTFPTTILDFLQIFQLESKEEILMILGIKKIGNSIVNG